ncbi:RNA-binding S4 domain-containing protein [Herbaspirillum robiniae]|uniref:RNA-binding S4 domain-containing protein n=1 Tax=Herbaspirillum robiniae TaxID=2014887 RepID=A0A246WK94_9BURK|nr:RNA-binding S4 domain-containing protein [Herbaspirillum robiniae]NUU03275.1 RNA-binding S4 domain-containing protein [Herbaspirillum robiniae]OWY26651.1 RNA-binding protein S4 [Herbaspirillum robiniae]
MDTTRIDKWCWAARFFKTRSLATEAIDRGRVRLNGDATKPSHNVRVGDRLKIDNGSTEWEVLVTGIADKRGSAAIAATLYGETEDSVRRREAEAERHRLFREPSAQIKGRPTKRDRRLLDRSSS